MNEKKENNMYYQTNIKTSRNEDISFLQLSYGNFVSLDDYMFLKKENQQLKEQYCERTDCSGRIGNSKKVEELEKENQQLKEIINTAKEELYIWGEILNPEFQKRMLEILEKSDKQ